MLTLQFVPYGEIEHLNIGERIDKLLEIVKKDRVVLMQGRLHPEEETQLIQETMTQIHEGFKGIEICTIFPEEKDLQLFKRLKKEMMKAIVGNRDGMTIIGPATIVKEIKRDPNKIMLLTNTRTPIKSTKSRSTARRRTKRKPARRQRRR
tara:strand:- start:12878 stop:13327 length:450 start_codon:yes stop_codon:yes gene_type:complete